MPRPARLSALVLLLVLGALAACERQGPPAPLIIGSDPTKSPGSESRPPTVLPPANPPADAAVNLPPKSVPPLSVQTLPPTSPPPVSAAPTKAELPKASPPALVPQAHPPHPDQITVQKGETLYLIARRYDMPVRSIIDANHLEAPYQLAAGTNLTLPQARFHTVQAGETLYGVSRRYGVEVSTLASINHLTEPFAIRSGQTLSLPAPSLPDEKSLPAPAAAKPDNAAPEAEEPPPGKPPAPSVSNERPANERLSSERAGPKPRAGRVFAWPLEGRVIEAYGTGPSGTHNDGINIAARAGEPVRAADTGRVAYAGNALRGYGNLVLIKHAGGYMTAYAHNGKLLVKRGEAVKRGQEIAKAGATGTVRTPQLHFEIRQGTRALDPTNYLPSLRASN